MQFLQFLQLQLLLLPVLSSATLVCCQSHFFPLVFLRTQPLPGRHRCRPDWRGGSDHRPPEVQEIGQVWAGDSEHPSHSNTAHL